MYDKNFLIMTRHGLRWSLLLARRDLSGLLTALGIAMLKGTNRA
jgi:hypothetical protein